MKLSANTRRGQLSTFSLIAVNLIPLMGVLFFQWDVALVVLIYWCENLIVGAYNLLKMATAASPSEKSPFAKLFFLPFFALHYGGFCAVHGFFLVSLLSIGDGADHLMQGDHFGPFIFLQMLTGVVAYLWQEMGVELLWPIVGLVVSHGISMAENYYLDGEYRRVGLSKLMGAPYGRIVVMHVAVLFGAMLILHLGSPLPLLLLLIALKIGLDIQLHKRSHTRLKATD